MPRHNSTDTGRLFDAAQMLSHNEQKLLSVLFTLGYTEADLDTVTIDQLVEKSMELFPQSTGEDQDTTNNTSVRSHHYGATAFMFKQNRLVQQLIRLSWWDRHLASWTVSNG